MFVLMRGWKKDFHQRVDLIILMAVYLEDLLDKNNLKYKIVNKHM